MKLTDGQSRWLFGFSFLTSASLIFWKLTSYSLWFDEAYSSALARSGPSDIITNTAGDVHPPLYYLVLHVWTRIFGESDFAMRSLSAILMLLAVLLLLYVLKRLVEKRYAYVAASFAALAPFTLRYAAETRMYALAAVFVIAATWVFLVQVQAKRRKREWKTWMLYALLMTAAAYTHYFSVFIIFAHLAYALFHDTRTKDGKTWLARLKNRISLVDRRFLKTLGVISVFFLPWLPSLLTQIGRTSDYWWVSEISAESVVNVFVMMGVFREVGGFDVPMVVSYGVLALLGWQIYNLSRISKKADEKKALWFIFACFVFPAIGLIVLSLLPQTASYVYWRFFAQFSLFFYAGVMFVALLTSKYYSKFISTLVFLPLVTMLFVGSVRVLDGADRIHVTFHEQFDAVLEDYQEGDVFVASGVAVWYVADHYNTTDAPTFFVRSAPDNKDHIDTLDRDENIIRETDINSVSNVAQRVWLVEPEDKPREVPDNWFRTMSSKYGGTLNIVLYEVR